MKMMITDLIVASRRVRIAAVGAVVVVSGVAVWAAWVRGSPLIVVVVLLFALVGLALTKAVLEVAVNASEIGRKQELLADGAAADLSDQLTEVESRLEKQSNYAETILNRVRSVEHRTGDHRKFSEAVLDRVRALETRAGDQRIFNDRLLQRVRSVESRLKPAATAPPGRARRLQQARDMLEAATLQVSGSDLVTSVGDDSHGSIRRPVRPSDGRAAVTVVVPCFNDGDYVAEALESIRTQSLAEWECIVVDDASSDESLAKIHQATIGDDRFKLVTHDENLGVSAARNAGLERAAGAYVVFHDADDLMMKDSLADRVRTLDRHHGMDVAGAFCGVRIADDGIRLDELPDSESWQPRVRFADFVSSRGECPFPLTAAIVRTDLVREIGGFREDMSLAEDWDLWLRIMRLGFFFVPAELRTVIYRQSPSSAAQTHAMEHVEASNRLIAASHSYSELSEEHSKASFPFEKAIADYEEIIVRTRTRGSIRGDEPSARRHSSGRGDTQYVGTWLMAVHTSSPFAGIGDHRRFQKSVRLGCDGPSGYRRRVCAAHRDTRGRGSRHHSAGRTSQQPVRMMFRDIQTAPTMTGPSGE